MIFHDIKLHYPNIWIQDSEPSRIVDIITQTIDKEYYSIDFTEGFSKLCDDGWRAVLVPDPATEGTSYTTTFDHSVIMAYLLDMHKETPARRTLFVQLFNDPQSELIQFSVYLNYLKNFYRTAFWENDISQIPLQFVFLSPHPCPEQYEMLFRIQEELNPNIDELALIVTHINESCDNLMLREENAHDIAKAGLGLTEQEFIKLSLNSILENSYISAKYISDVKTTNIKKNGILEIIKPQVGFDDIAGLDNIKDIINRTAKLRENYEKAKAFGIVPIRRLLMVGVPGTGKSAICQATAKQLNLDLARTGISQVMNSFVGQSEANMRTVFRQIKALSPLCVWIDEFGRDLSGGSSSSHVDAGTTDRVHGEFLTGLQELPEETFLLCAANQLDALRPEMLRADRFDKIMFVGLPSRFERESIFRIHLDKIETDHNYDYDLLAEKSQYMTGAEIVSLIKETKFYVTSDAFRPIETKDILQRIPYSKNLIWLKHQDMVKSMYTYALEQWEWASTLQLEEASHILGRSAQKNNTKMIFS